ncbi:UDP-N-acetylmuramate dehydrogenase [Dehalobacter restrictus]|uniref:UDP-N-acetylenolpyruvoylglucosamine reductase n=1 Tax=Dehalobacter restrictus TaxID=55583 RepID=A0A857DIM5_9FIRM|nr:UDP-N-acetylmuramate dehydrogenase [Dehalobacter restrictus]QHA01190.1 UDP-N-acetylmuramate dehydrogenase [Dehalobacter restrictus]
MYLPNIKGRIEKDYPLKKLNTWRIGGMTELAVWPRDTEELVSVIDGCRKNNIPFLLLGRGSNVLLPDNGFKGVVIVVTAMNSIRWHGEEVTAEAGYSLMRLAREAGEIGLSGLEFACGIPGTLGAAAAINAGAYGGKIGDLVKKVSVLTAEGKIEIIPKDQIAFGYRSSSLLEKECIVLECTLSLHPGDQAVIQAQMQGLMAKRKEHQPLEYPNAGSVFRNPAGDSAGRLIEQAGWKGRRLGDAQVSEKHANFIVNRGNASSTDILTLIQVIQTDVSEKFDIQLETEIRVI